MQTPQGSPPEPPTASSPNPPLLSQKRYALLCAAPLVAGLLLRLFFIHRFSQVTGDSLIYGDFARNWLQHGVYGFSQQMHGLPAPPRPSLIRLPGYPLFLAVCFLIFGNDHYIPVLLVQAVIDLSTCWLIASLARRLFGPRISLIALWLAALCPFTANFVALPLTETLTIFTIALAFYGLHRWQQAGPTLNRWLYLTAAALAYSVLLRPEQGLLAAAIIPAILYISLNQIRPTQEPGHPDRRRAVAPQWRDPRIGFFLRSPKSLLRAARPALVASLLTILPLIPWTIRNELTFHVFQPLAPRFATDPGEFISNGFQRWYRTWAIDFASTETTYWNWDNDTLQISDLPNRAFDSNTQYSATEALYADYNRTTAASPALDARFAALASARVHADPLRYYLALPIARVLNMTFRPRIDFLPMPLEWWRFRLHPKDTLFALLYGALNLAYFALAAVALHRRRTLFLMWPGQAPLLYAMLATILFRSLLLLTMDNSEPRYTLEFFPILIPLAAAALTQFRLQPPVTSGVGSPDLNHFF